METDCNPMKNVIRGDVRIHVTGNKSGENSGGLQVYVKMG